jgi:hypothetical protein
MSDRRVIGIWIALGACSACAASDRSSGADYGYMPEDLPSGEQCDTGQGSGGATDGCATGSTTAPRDGSMGSPCDGSAECDEGLICSASFDGERGVFACVGGCIGIMDEARWCADASACCDPNATCSPRGYCTVTSDDTTTSTDSTSTTGHGESSGTTTTG